MRFLSALALLWAAAGLALAGCRQQEPPPPPVETTVEPDTAGGGVPAPTADEINAGAGILQDALEGAAGP